MRPRGDGQEIISGNRINTDWLSHHLLLYFFCAPLSWDKKINKNKKRTKKRVNYQRWKQHGTWNIQSTLTSTVLRRRLTVARLVTALDLMKLYAVLWRSTLQCHGSRVPPISCVVAPSGYEANPFHYTPAWGMPWKMTNYYLLCPVVRFLAFQTGRYGTVRS